MDNKLLITYLQEAVTSIEQDNLGSALARLKSLLWFFTEPQYQYRKILDTTVLELCLNNAQDMLGKNDAEVSGYLADAQAYIKREKAIKNEPIIDTV